MDKDYVMVSSQVPVYSHLMFYTSYLVMAYYMCSFFFLNLRKKQKSLYEENKMMDDDECEKLAAQSKKQGYRILLGTMMEYHKKYQDVSFENFLKIYWNKDYDIYLKNEKGDTSCKRDYSNWEYWFKLTYKKLRDEHEWVLMD